VVGWYDSCHKEEGVGSVFCLLDAHTNKLYLFPFPARLRGGGGCTGSVNRIQCYFQT